MRLGLTFGNVAPSRITVVDAKTGVARTVTDSVSSNVAPRWAPDGRTLLFVSDRLGPWDIYALQIGDDGAAIGPPRRLTVGLNVHTFSLSADGSRLAYAVMTQGSNVWSQPWSETASSTATVPTQITFGQQIVESVKISRDGQWLYYDSNISGNADLYRMRLPVGLPERLTTDRTAEFAPNPSPDGRSVAFHAWRTGSRDVYIMPLDGGPVEQVTRSSDQESNTAWSPDGRTLSFMIQAAPGALYLARRNASGTWETRKRLSGAYWIAWSPDGRNLSYATSIFGGGLRVVAADSGEPRALYDETAPGAPLAEVSSWSADGRTIYFKSHSANGAVALWSVPSAGGQPHRLFALGDGRLRSDRYGFTISHGRLYYTMFDRQSNVWVMDVGK
jgi:TolB protein